MPTRVTRAGVAVVLAAALLIAAVTAVGATSDTLSKTTLDQRIVAGAPGAFRFLQLGPGEGYAVREDGVGAALPGRETTRTSLVYFGQLSDFQLADEESPARVEFIDPLSGPLGLPFDAAWRPWEALQAQISDAMIRQINAFAPASPVPGAGGSQRAMDFVLNTGDSADSQQFNETQWVRTLLEGGSLNPNSGINKDGYLHALCTPVSALVPGPPEPSRYTGIQDYNDYLEGPFPEFYDPNDPRGVHAAWPRYPGLMNRAQNSFSAAGLSVPSYVVFGNHDGLVQGNAAANQVFEQVATGCLKLLVPSSNPQNLAQALNALTPQNMLNVLATAPQNLLLVPPDPKRRFVDKKQYKQVFQNGSQADGHGFDYIDPAERSASKGAAGYYSWNPVPGFRFIALDTVSEAGVVGPSADGNIDDPQFRWLRSELQEATSADELVVVFSHHAIASLTANLPDELAPPCTVADGHGHDVNPGCDVDPRNSQPIHLGADLVNLLHQFPNAVAWVAGHSHENKIDPFPNPSGSGGFWSIRVAAEADWPQQSRLLEVFDNNDGTLSIFGTILDHAGQAVAPGSGTAAAGMDLNDLASVGRTLSFNDFQVGAPDGEGTPADRNVELLLDDPRVP
jgi:metallophosphoesterase (TIGR03767 family)